MEDEKSIPNQPARPTLRRRRLGEALRKFRNQTGMSLEQAAETIGWDRTRLSKVELAKGHISAAGAAKLLSTYGVDAPDVLAAIEALARDAGKRGWWKNYGDVVDELTKDYLSLETDAESTRICSPNLIPGLFQTGAYAREIIAAGSFWRPIDEVNAFAEVRKARQAVLTAKRDGGRPPLSFWAVIHEAVLHQRFPSQPTLMREQLRHLLDMSDLPNITIQVMPMAMVPNPAMMGLFEVVRFPAPWPTVVLVENLVGGQFVEGTEHVDIYEQAFERVVATALPVADSREIIKRIMEKD
ncbi:helix-turn-helix domain-containing protein [Streptomyces griseocarneus]|uniref:helix-turn-helix domain-containing protein n=1 Tax=Streptomyces griseocarneus TaxID=51201 RepID=UPI0019851864|nr:helix-turn-helix transcriptional regulator [Streptomyces griseocarneus]MBZ6476687.1 helix-turn-helix transcriptional regulator [Streptomyces griseocarneus]GHG80338.1 transcriptional regulator [Streptomyces griseocarneus]